LQQNALYYTSIQGIRTVHPGRVDIYRSEIEREITISCDLFWVDNTPQHDLLETKNQTILMAKFN